MAAKTVGFAVADEDRDILDRLVERYGRGNRSEFLRAAMKVMAADEVNDLVRKVLKPRG
jgi:Arc/MetJ-type ribon-helix-helix transcriptional regulator